MQSRSRLDGLCRSVRTNAASRSTSMATRHAAARAAAAATRITRVRALANSEGRQQLAPFARIEAESTSGRPFRPEIHALDGSKPVWRDGAPPMRESMRRRGCRGTQRHEDGRS